MNTNLAINETLLERAFHVGGLRTEGETVNLALEEFIKRRAMEDVNNRKRKSIKDLKGKIKFREDYDYKAMRH